jgi:hypothetical protein
LIFGPKTGSYRTSRQCSIDRRHACAQHC